MPEGLLEGLTEQQLRDFFAYLRISQPISKCSHLAMNPSAPKGEPSPSTPLRKTMAPRQKLWVKVGRNWGASLSITPQGFAVVRGVMESFLLWLR
jgi:hypothetical protein